MILNLKKCPTLWDWFCLNFMFGLNQKKVTMNLFMWFGNTEFSLKPKKKNNVFKTNRVYVFLLHNLMYSFLFFLSLCLINFQEETNVIFFWTRLKIIRENQEVVFHFTFLLETFQMSNSGLNATVFLLHKILIYVNLFIYGLHFGAFKFKHAKYRVDGKFKV